MGTIKKGRLAETAYTMQPNREVVVKADGSAEGQVVYECDLPNILKLPRLYSFHPDDATLVAHNIQLTYLELARVRASYSYFGLTASYSGDMRTIEYDGGCDQVPIQTHPDFSSFAGTPSSPSNGAIWVDATTGDRTSSNTNAIFRGFEPSSSFAGTEYYLVARPVVTRTWYQRSPPALPSAMSIVNSVPGVATPGGIKNWLCLGGSYRKMGGYFQVSVQYKGSPPPGWNRDIYG